MINWVKKIPCNILTSGGAAAPPNSFCMCLPNSTLTERLFQWWILWEEAACTGDCWHCHCHWRAPALAPMLLKARQSTLKMYERFNQCSGKINWSLMMLPHVWVLWHLIEDELILQPWFHWSENHRAPVSVADSSNTVCLILMSR